MLFERLEAFALGLGQTSPEVAGRLEMLRTRTLAALDPADTKQNNTDSALDTTIMGMDNLMSGLDSFEIVDIAMAYSRAGLYIYLNAAVRHPAPSSTWLCLSPLGFCTERFT